MRQVHNNLLLGNCMYVVYFPEVLTRRIRIILKLLVPRARHEEQDIDLVDELWTKL